LNLQPSTSWMTCHLSLMRLLYHCTIPAMMNSPSHVICSLSIVCTTIVYLPPLVMNVLCLYLCYHNTYEMCFWHCNTNRTPHRLPHKISKHAILEAQKQFKILDKMDSMEPCSQTFYKGSGIPCSHMIGQILEERADLEPDDFHSQWCLDTTQSAL